MLVRNLLKYLFLSIFLHIQFSTSNEVDDPDADNQNFTISFQPIIGIISQPLKGSNNSDVQLSYVNFIEMGGGRVAPIPLDTPDDELFFIAKSINGVLFPGGGTVLDKDSRYYSIHKFFMDYSKKEFHKGNYFPIWGTCLGFQAIAQYVSNNFTLIPNSSFHNFNVLLPIEWNTDTEMLHSSTLLNLCQEEFQDLISHPHIEKTNKLPKSSMDAETHHEFSTKRDLHGSVYSPHENHHNHHHHHKAPLMCNIRTFKATQNMALAAYNHKFGVSVTDWDFNTNLGEFFNPLGYSISTDGVKFVAVMEGKYYPFFAVQFHPEKNLFAFAPSINAPHGFYSAEMSQYFANFIISQARKSTQRFPDPVTEFNHLIFKYQTYNSPMSDKIYDFLPMFTFPMNSSMLNVTVSIDDMDKWKKKISTN